MNLLFSLSQICRMFWWMFCSNEWNYYINRNCARKTKFAKKPTREKFKQKKKNLEINRIQNSFVYVSLTAEMVAKCWAGICFPFWQLAFGVGICARVSTFNTVLVPLWYFPEDLQLFSQYPHLKTGGCVTTKTDRFSNICLSTCPIITKRYTVLLWDYNSSNIHRFDSVCSHYRQMHCVHTLQDCSQKLNWET